MDRDKYKLSYSPKELINVSKITETLYYEEIDNIEDIREGTVSIHTMYVFDMPDKVEVKVLIINASSKNINFGPVMLALVDSNQTIALEQALDLSEAGLIPSMNIRPFTLIFDKKNLKNDAVIKDDYKVIIKPENVVGTKSANIEISFLDEKLSLYDKRLVEEYVQNMPPVVKGDIKIIPYKSDIDNEGNSYTVLLLVNGLDKNAKFAEFLLTYKSYMQLPDAVKKVNDLPSVSMNSIAAIKVILNDTEIINKNFNIKECEVTVRGIRE